MRTVYMERIFRLLPKVYRDNIKPVLKLTSAGSRRHDIITTVDKLFLFSEVEVFGERHYSLPGEGEQYEHFCAPQHRQFGKPTALRSPIGSHGTFFCIVLGDGSANYHNASYSSGVAFGFCI